MFKRTAVFFTIIFFIFITGCSGKDAGQVASDMPDTSEAQISEAEAPSAKETETQDRTPALETQTKEPEASADIFETDEPDSEEDLFATSKPGDDVIVRRDPEGLVEARIEDGYAVISFNYPKWKELHNIDEYALEWYGDATFVTETLSVPFLSGRVRDVRVGKVSALDPWAIEFVMPAVLLLMEDGKLEWFVTNPYFTGWMYTNGVLPWLPEIVSISYENDGEGFGEMTFIATDASGLEYDVRKFCWLTNVFAGEWVHDFETDMVGDMLCLFLAFGEDGSLSMRKGLFQAGDAYAFYIGNYSVSTFGSRSLLSINLWDEFQQDSLNPDLSAPPDISGKYIMDADGVILDLYLSEGDTLEYGVAHYQFWQYYGYEENYFLGYDELVEYLIENVEQARKMIYERGMSVQETGAFIELDGIGFCTQITIGTDHPEHFVSEAFYAVADNGEIYVYDALDDIWYLIYVPGAVG